MLLYARTAAPKARNTRSRAGCRFCKEMRKKCDECRPECSRCKEYGKDCIYDPVRPRRRYQTPATGSGVSPPLLGNGSSKDVWGMDMTSELFPGICQMVSSTAVNSPILDAPDPPAFSEWNKEPISFVSQTCPEPCLGFPPFCEFSTVAEERLLLAHFTCVLSELMTLSPGDTNPFQELILPLCLDNMALLNAVCALSTGHLEYQGIHSARASSHFHAVAVQHLVQMLADLNVARDEVLPVIMMLTYYEAMFNYFDVISALSLATAPLSPLPRRGMLVDPCLIEESRLNSVDALLGKAGSLWPTLHRLAQLLDLKKEFQAAKERKENAKAAVLREELRICTDAIQYSLENWEPCSETDQDGASEVLGDQSATHSALSYRHSSLVYLFRTIHNYPRSHYQVQSHVRASLEHCNDAVSAAGPMGALLWPLFVAACEAISVADRTLAEKAFLAVSKRQGMANVDRAWALTQQIWEASSGEVASRGMLASHHRSRGDGQCIREVAMASKDSGFGLILG
ncbi:Zn(2)-C6 fungal-type domain-containing protein [Fusarium keratoplasticum]|nr:Zn(2)-C6 fungal-type domain-containing protein [Fusarium keratoplasticum]